MEVSESYCQFVHPTTTLMARGLGIGQPTDQAGCLGGKYYFHPPNTPRADAQSRPARPSARSRDSLRYRRSRFSPNRRVSARSQESDCGVLSGENWVMPRDGHKVSKTARLNSISAFSSTSGLLACLRLPNLAAKAPCNQLTGTPIRALPSLTTLSRSCEGRIAECLWPADFGDGRQEQRVPRLPNQLVGDAFNAVPQFDNPWLLTELAKVPCRYLSVQLGTSATPPPARTGFDLCRQLNALSAKSDNRLPRFT
ncbi:hypothetical protein N657DRAFT_195358 [Parathielavia appendiculata]|uniref:Uncharacterized protein n=1 Tax=Parathielavia appendiculata TaxID=2587402 RepID=A0AAN6U659_9PEZI|nr:hypothetical protein N657DRAFT_195358 [Parathielavia appendiculata]